MNDKACGTYIIIGKPYQALGRGQPRNNWINVVEAILMGLEMEKNKYDKRAFHQESTKFEYEQ